jgi:D-xylose transport system ATP-binding protein
MSMLEMQGIIKDFPGVRALGGVSLRVRSGEVVALCGENGAGKSTLMKILSGLHPYGSFSGELILDGKTLRFRNVADSVLAGIAIVHQELSIIPELTIAENLFLGHEAATFGFVRSAQEAKRSQDLLARVGLSVHPDSSASALSVGEQQLLEIAKALSTQPKFLIFDEPTSALSPKEVRKVLDVIRNIRKEGVGCVIISHKLEEVFEIADSIAVIRDGVSISLSPTGETRTDLVIKDMVGRDLHDIYPTKHYPTQLGEPILEVQNLTTSVVKDVSFSVHRGEILGIAGLMGSGRSELLHSIFGTGPKILSGDIRFEGRPFICKSPVESVRQGLALVTEDRKRLGLVLDQTIQDNSTLTAMSMGQWVRTMGWIQPAALRKRAAELFERLHIKAPGLDSITRNLSGGNQQKVVLSKWLMTLPKVLFLDEPTRGIDVGARGEFYHLIRDLADQGLGVVVVSSELPEVLGLSHRVLVLSEGRAMGELETRTATPESVMRLAVKTKTDDWKESTA